VARHRKEHDLKSKILILLIVTVLALGSTVPGAGQEQEKKEIKPVLLVMDVQNRWMPLMAEADRESAPGKINESIALFRKYGYPVIAVYHTDPNYGPEPGTEPFEFPGSIDIKEGDPKIVKNYGSAFTKTDLEQVCRDSERNTVFLCGLSATGCVLATYFGALDREFRVLMVEDALLSHKAEYTDVIEDICYSVTIEELEDILKEPNR
jgi:nicotinamidase-related amidase